MWTRVLAFTLALVPIGRALPQNHLDDQVDAFVEAGTFEDPSVNVRPRIRYWLPDASINVDNLAKDISGIGSVGFGGIELLNYFLYGGAEVNPNATIPVNWDVYGYGTPAYADVLQAALRASKDSGLIMDFCMGPQSGQGVPAKIDDPGLTYILNSFNRTVAPGSNFNAVIPGYGTGKLVSVATADIIKVEARTLDQAAFTGQILSSNYTLYTLSSSSLKDATSEVSSNGKLKVNFASRNESILGHLVYASYYTQPLTRACVPGGPDPQNFIQNGSFAVDHFSARGAETTTEFLEKYVLVKGNKELMMEVGNYIWEDSVEISTSLPYWTPLLQEVFQKQHGYSINAYVPLLHQLDGNALSFPRADLWYVLDTEDQGQGYVEDYRSTLTYLYGTYLQALTKWTNNYLNLQMSSQVGYNLPVNMQSDIPNVNAPETESLGFGNNIEAYRKYVGPANLAGKRVISMEVGASLFQIYSFTLPDLLSYIKRGFAAGVNQYVVHGSPYSYNYPETTWPGYTPFLYYIGEMHQRHQPAWDNGYREAIDWVARMQFLEQTGIPKRDVVFWAETTAENSGIISTLYEPMDLIETGYSYEYVTPNNFDLPLAIVKNSVLGPSGPSYKVMVIRANDTLTVDGVVTLGKFAQDGLPIVISGGQPRVIGTANSTASAYISSVFQSISSLKNVYSVPTGGLAKVLKKIGIIPLTQVESNSTWYTYWRRAEKVNADYVYIFNNGNYSEGSITFQSTGIPYVMDSWTGQRTPVLNYSKYGNFTKIFFKLAEQQTAVVAFAATPIQGISLPRTHITSAPENIIGFSYSDAKGLIAKAIACTTASCSSLVTSNGSRHNVNADGVPAAFTVSNWDLQAEHWQHPETLSDVDTIAVKHNTTHSLPVLMPWSTISGLSNTSGIGYYSSNFTWPPGHSADTGSLGAIIDFGAIVQALRVKINGHALQALDVTWAQADITQFLVQGVNHVEALVPTTMFNGLRPIWDQLMTANSTNLTPLSLLGPETAEGLVNPVKVTPYRSIVLGY